jgi:hypothetical protein
LVIETPSERARLRIFSSHGDSRQSLFGYFRRGDDRPIVFAFG